ncbi:MAG TPA: hemolysin family protein [Phycisphaerae bacterium]|nr:hemolysin family protein [Phycisphaerae bacterium]
MTIAALLILWTLLTLFAGTAANAVQVASRSRLQEGLERLGRSERLESFDHYHHEYALTGLIFRQLGIVLFVLTVAVASPSRAVWYRQPLEVFLYSAPWFLVFGVAVPAAWARHTGDRYLARVLPVLEWTRRITSPVLTVVRLIDEIVRRLAGVPRRPADATEQVEQEILDALSEGESRGDVNEQEKKMIRSVINLDETSVGEIMTPRTDIVALEHSAGHAEVLELVRNTGHSRIPVYEETIDHVIGVLYTKDLLNVDKPEAFSLKTMMRPVPFVPVTKDVASCLHEFQTGRVHIAIVLDEYGGTSGLVTIEDLLEELVGEIADEHDEPPVQPIRKIDAQTAEVDARVNVEEVNQALELSLPVDEAYDTIGGFVLSRLGRIPTPGESFMEDRVRIEVLEARPRSVQRVRVSIHDGAAAS